MRSLDEYVEYDSNPLHRRDSAGNYEKQKLIRGVQATSTHYYEEDSAGDQLPLHAAAYYGKFSTLSASVSARRATQKKLRLPITPIRPSCFVRRGIVR